MNEPVRQRRARSRAPDRETILDAAAELFGERGFQNTTMQDLADRVGIAKPTLYAHAKSKTEILEGIFDRVLTDVEGRVAKARQEPTPTAQLEELTRSLTRAGANLRAQYKVFFGDERELPARLVRYYRRWSAETMVSVRDMISEGQRSGDLGDEVDPTVAAFALFALANWTARWFDPEGPLPIEDVATMHLRLLLGGLGSPASASRPPQGDVAPRLVPVGPPGQDGPGHEGTGQDGPGHEGTGQDGPGHDGTGQDGPGPDGPAPAQRRGASRTRARKRA